MKGKGATPGTPLSFEGCVSCGPGALLSAGALLSPSVVRAASAVVPVVKENLVVDLVEVARKEKLVGPTEHVAKVRFAAHRRMKSTDGRMNFDLLEA